MLKIKPTSSEYKKIQREIVHRVDSCIPLIEDMKVDLKTYITRGLDLIPQTKNKRNLDVYKTFIEKSTHLLSQTTEKIVIHVNPEIIEYLLKAFKKQFVYQFLDGIHARYNKNIALNVSSDVFTEVLKFLSVHDIYGNLSEVNSWFSNQVSKNAKMFYNNYTMLYASYGVKFNKISELGLMKRFTCHYCKLKRYPYEKNKCRHAKCLHHPGRYLNYRWTCCGKTNHQEEWECWDLEGPTVSYMRYIGNSTGCTRSICRPDRFQE
jgi:hypothetical protein